MQTGGWKDEELHEHLTANRRVNPIHLKAEKGDPEQSSAVSHLVDWGLESHPCCVSEESASVSCVCRPSV